MRFNTWKGFITLAYVVLGLLVLGNTMSSGQAPKEKSAAAWEYRTIFGTASQSNDDRMNELGNKGWVLHTVVEEPGAVVRFVFQRAKQQAVGEAKTEDDK